MILFFSFVNLTLEFEHSLHHWGKERRFQQLGPGLHLVAGGISRLASRGVTRVRNIIDGLGRLRGGTGSAAIPREMASIGAATLEATIVVLEVCSFCRGKWCKTWAPMLLLVVELGCNGVDSHGKGLDLGHKGAGGGVDANVVDFHGHWIKSWGWSWDGVGGVRAHAIHSTREHTLCGSSGSKSIDVVEAFCFGTHVEESNVGVGYLVGTKELLEVVGTSLKKDNLGGGLKKGAAVGILGK
jgi:hypothetical protein